MKLIKKIKRDLTAFAMAPLVGLETKERKRRAKEKLKRIKQKTNDLSFNDI